MNFLMKKGSLYLKYNGNLLIHGCIPVDEDGNMEQMEIDGGHTPVKEIDGTTGIAGYTLLYNSYGMQLVAHQHFNSKKNVLLNGADALSVRRIVDEELQRKNHHQRSQSSLMKT